MTAIALPERRLRGLRPLHHDRVHDDRPAAAGRSPGRSRRTTTARRAASTSRRASAIPKKAYDARANPKVSLLFSEPHGSGIEQPPMVLVQGTADVDDRDLDANRERYWEESVAKLPGHEEHASAEVHARDVQLVLRAPLRARAAGAGLRVAGRRRDRRARAARLAHGGGALRPRRGARRGARPAGRRHARVGRADGRARRPLPSGVLSIVSPDGFPFSVRVPIDVDRSARLVRLGTGAVGVPVHPGPACLVVHEHGPTFKWQRNFQVRGDLVERDGDWALVPHKLVGGFELPPGSIARYRRTSRRSGATARSRSASWPSADRRFPQIAGSSRQRVLTDRGTWVQMENRDAAPSATKSGSRDEGPAARPPDPGPVGTHLKQRYGPRLDFCALPR